MKTSSIQRPWLKTAFLIMWGLCAGNIAQAADQEIQLKGGPVDIVVEGNRIASIENVSVPQVPIDENGRPGDATFELDASGSYVMPGFVNNHIHTGDVPKAPAAEYPYKLWMAHGITTDTRRVGGCA